MISFCYTLVKLCELKFQPSAHLSTNHGTDLQSGLQGYPSIKGQLISEQICGVLNFPIKQHRLRYTSRCAAHDL